MTDIVERLRDYGSNPMVQSEYSLVPARELLEAADEIERVRGTLIELRLRYHAAGRRPEECYEMSMIDEALNHD